MNTTCRYLTEDAKMVFNTYRPIYTEVDGACHLIGGVVLLGITTYGTLSDSIHFGIRSSGVELGIMAMEGSCLMIAKGLTRLSLPIIISTGYLISRNYP